MEQVSTAQASPVQAPTVPVPMAPVLSMQESGRRPIRRALLLTFRWAVLPPVPPRRRAGDLDEH